MNDFWFLSFANSDLGGKIRDPLKRIRRQAEAMCVFGNRIRIWTEADLDADFRSKMKDRLVPGSRGYGYWCWKPQVVLQLLREMKNGDVLLYADAGCHLNPKGVKRLLEYRELAKQHGIVAFQARTQNAPPVHFLLERMFTKGDLLDYFGVRDNQEVTESGQLGGTVSLFRKDPDSIGLVKKWRQTFFDDFCLCDDSPSKSANLPGYRENRHDQSVFSILGKKTGVFSLSSLEYDPMNGGDNWKGMSGFPIWARHDKGGIRSLFPNWFKRIVHVTTGGCI